MNRTRTCLGDDNTDRAGLLYDVRSAVEHLNGPFFAFDNGLNPSAAEVLLNRCGFEAEAMARHCLRTLFLRERLWPHFRDDESIRGFWQLPAPDRRELWGDPIDIEWVAERFRENDVIEHVMAREQRNPDPAPR